MSYLKSTAFPHQAESPSLALRRSARAKRSSTAGSSSKRPTIRIVAAKAGVAVSTVSRYLNDESVSPRMKARLSRVIASLGFKPSRTAQNLSLGLKGCIGVVVDSIQDPWFTQLLTGMEEELQSRDTSLMLLSLELRDRYDPAIAFEWIDERRVDGLIIANSHRRDKALVRAALDAQVPMVAIAPDEALANVPVVRADDVAARCSRRHSSSNRCVPRLSYSATTLWRLALSAPRSREGSRSQAICRSRYVRATGSSWLTRTTCCSTTCARTSASATTIRCKSLTSSVVFEHWSMTGLAAWTPMRRLRNRS
jgi:Periplasmic binding proteins and sugar binding domain of LacI family